MFIPQHHSALGVSVPADNAVNSDFIYRKKITTLPYIYLIPFSFTNPCRAPNCTWQEPLTLQPFQKNEPNGAATAQRCFSLIGPLSYVVKRPKG